MLNEAGRLVSTREPGPSPGPRFMLIRGPVGCAWAAHADLPGALAAGLDALARSETPSADVRAEPVHATRYRSLLGDRVEFGPAFEFPAAIPAPAGCIVVTHLSQLGRHLRGWTADELPERGPIVAIAEDGHAVSVCFCARRSPAAAEAGVETAERFRGRGYAPRVTAAWALAVRASGRLPIYSTSWDNEASLAVARKLGLDACAGNWSVYG